MNIEVSTTIIFNVLLIISVAQIFSFYRFRAINNEQEKKIKALKNDVQALLLCARGVGEKLHNQQSEFRNIQDRQDKLELGDGLGDVSYQQVIALMNRGATADEMVSSCDLTQGEVELLAHIQNNHKKTKTQNRVLAA